MNTFNDDRHDETDPLSVLLNDLPQVDPPQTLVGTVMTTIQQQSQIPAVPPAVVRRDRTMAKKAIWAIAAAAAVALAIMGVGGFPAVDKGTEATIGAAQRYQSQQISDADVKTGDAQLQAFLQSDLFHKLATDKAAQAALKNKDFQKALADSSVRAALANPGVQDALASMSLEAAKSISLDASKSVSLEAAKVDIAAFAARLDAAGARLDAAGRAALEAALEASPSLAQALAAPGIAQAIGNSSLSAALARPDVAGALATDAAIKALSDAAAPGASLDAAASAPGAAGATRNASAGASAEQ